MCEAVDGYIEEIAQLRIELFEMQTHRRDLLCRNGDLEAKSKIQDAEVADLKSEIARHHKDFHRVSRLAEDTEKILISTPGVPTTSDLAVVGIKTIRNIVG